MDIPDSPQPVWQMLHLPCVAPEALVVVLQGTDRSDMTAFVPGWHEAVPRAAFAAILTERKSTADAALISLIRARIDEMGLTFGQVVLVGAGSAGHVALDLVLQGRAPGAGAIVVDLPRPALPRVMRAAPASLRFVQHRDEDDPEGRAFHEMIRVLRDLSFDIRTFALWDGPDPTNGALNTFLVELVAHASRYPSAARHPTRQDDSTDAA